ncbi:hypothetical protein CSB45_06450 [candidate division KSB3 bacterium]|uniref:Uncharacterized protein n=1 Tax=candidate division KSB3 bacterium TaxID=2044937 RepID=A0A2G6E726_9BACT|nr:MAG: hypothetical protein CSB45_06450 [candidate division KSB3 bacterium]PIE30281.1 MAG: hypothetical protein CSA57_05165 [candidate division KSB3 bacterium]
MKKGSVYLAMQVIYKLLKQKEIISDAFIQKAIHVDVSTQERADKMSEEEQVIWYMLMVMYKMIFDEAGRYYKYKESDPEKFHFLNGKSPFYQSMNRVDLTRSYIFEQAEKEAKDMTFKDLEQKTGVLLDPKKLGNVIRMNIIRLSQDKLL